MEVLDRPSAKNAMELWIPLNQLYKWKEQLQEGGAGHPWSTAMFTVLYVLSRYWRYILVVIVTGMIELRLIAQGRIDN